MSFRNLDGSGRDVRLSPMSDKMGVPRELLIDGPLGVEDKTVPTFGPSESLLTGVDGTGRVSWLKG